MTNKKSKKKIVLAVILVVLAVILQLTAVIIANQWNQPRMVKLLSPEADRLLKIVDKVEKEEFSSLSKEDNNIFSSLALKYEYPKGTSISINDNDKSTIVFRFPIKKHIPAIRKDIKKTVALTALITSIIISILSFVMLFFGFSIGHGRFSLSHIKWKKPVTLRTYGYFAAAMGTFTIITFILSIIIRQLINIRFTGAIILIIISIIYALLRISSENGEDEDKPDNPVSDDSVNKEFHQKKEERE